MARGDVREDRGVAEVHRLLEVGAKERVDHAGGLALALREVDQLMRGARIGGARDPLEAEVDADAASLGGGGRVELAGALEGADLRLPVFRAWHAGGRHL